MSITKTLDVTWPLQTIGYVFGLAPHVGNQNHGWVKSLEVGRSDWCEKFITYQKCLYVTHTFNLLCQSTFSCKLETHLSHKDLVVALHSKDFRLNLYLRSETWVSLHVDSLTILDSKWKKVAGCWFYLFVLNVTAEQVVTGPQTTALTEHLRSLKGNKAPWTGTG